ncbi:hypothetical protein [Clostridium sp.]|uniref:hypothetical protein n=1 Tax=Clostridium sp. TaxID=1506 RepID=UPI003F66F200
MNQNIIKNAYNEKTFKKKIKCAKYALEVCENCSDAYILLSNDNGIDALMKEQLLRKAVKASIKVLGINNINNLKKEEFLKPELSSYLVSQYRLANHLWEVSKRNEAIKICMDIISKNPKDKLMIRSFLTSWTIIEGEDKYAEDLLKKYKDDYLTSIYYSRALYNIKIANITDGKIELRKAIAYNKYVVYYLLKMKHIPNNLPTINEFRSNEEAIHYMLYGYGAWTCVPEAIKILKELKREFSI